MTPEEVSQRSQTVPVYNIFGKIDVKITVSKESKNRTIEDKTRVRISESLIHSDLLIPSIFLLDY